MEENKKNELDQTLKIDVPTDESTDETDQDTEKINAVGISEIEVAEIEAVEVENLEAQDTPPIVETEKTKWHREKKAHIHKEKKPHAPKEPKPPRKPAIPKSEPALPVFICMVTFAISLLALIIDKFISPFSQELLAPVILQIIALVVPAYLSMMVTSGNKSMGAQFKAIGFRAVRAQYVFFVLFTALFTVCASLMLSLMLGGASDTSRGITLLGTFTAGTNEYTVSYPYLLLTYVLIPSVAEEFLFRSVIFSNLEKISFPLAAIISCCVSALYGFSLGGLIPSFFVAVMLVFVLYTTGSIVYCMIVHFIVNLYRLFLEANISAYFLSSQNNFLLLITVAIALAISSLLFFSESVRIFRAKAEKISNGEEKSAEKGVKFKSVLDELRSTFAYKPTLIFSIVCGVIFAAATIIGYLA